MIYYIDNYKHIPLRSGYAVALEKRRARLFGPDAKLVNAKKKQQEWMKNYMLEYRRSKPAQPK